MKRNTWQREAVREALDETEGFISAQALHSTLHANGSPIGLATVYRALGDLAANGEADSLQSPEGEALYRACSTTGHHHHLICRNCGLTVEIAADEVESWAKRVAAEHGLDCRGDGNRAPSARENRPLPEGEFNRLGGELRGPGVDRRHHRRGEAEPLDLHLHVLRRPLVNGLLKRFPDLLRLLPGDEPHRDLRARLRRDHGLGAGALIAGGEAVHIERRAGCDPLKNGILLIAAC